MQEMSDDNITHLLFCVALNTAMDNTTGICPYCNHKFEDMADVIKRDPILVERGEKDVVACKECYHKYLEKMKQDKEEVIED